MAWMRNVTISKTQESRQLAESSFSGDQFWDFFELAPPEGGASSSYGAVEKTRTSTGLPPQAPQACASTIPPRPHRDKRAALGDTARVKGAIADDS